MFFVEFLDGKDELSQEELERMTTYANRDLVVCHLQDLAFASSRIADNVDEIEGKCPSGNGGLIRAASKLLSAAEKSLRQRGV